MRPAFTVALLAAASFATAASADPSYKLDSIQIHGVRSVSVDQLLAGLKTKAGTTVTKSDLLDDQDALVKELEAAHIGGGVKTLLANKNNGHIDLIFNVDDQGVQAPKVVTVAPKLKDQLFAGNKKLTADDLTAASGLKAGDELNNARIQAAQAAIMAAYQKAGVGVTVAGNIAQDKAVADITWNIVEQKAPPKKKSKKHTDDEGGFAADAPGGN
jgi:outer membrane protein assembly factor BamA